ncbi:hypothetical protein BJ170DRAFT_75777 [Xylariales sp. AK1849]|nr:hypothetical protein BJ170DRAFT_75777 [Xylariales sp. AK1849]
MGSIGKAANGSQPLSTIQSVAIIGAGPSGLASAKYLLSQSQSSPSSPFQHITIFEQQAQVGGVWFYSATPSATRHIPQTSAFCPPDPPLRDVRTKEGKPVYANPMYEDLHTNIPHTLMQFSDSGFGAGGRIFPERDAVQAYLEHYAADVRHLIRFSTSVVDVKLRLVEGAREQWDLRSRDLLTDVESTATFDALVVASGHYSVTYVPELEGIREFDEAHPGVITHSKYYRTPGKYAGKRVLLVGNSASGLDIASQTTKVCRQPLWVSVRTGTPDDVREHVGFEEVGEIDRFLVEEKGVKLKDGREITGLDGVLFCTGYLFTFPFLESLDPPLVTDGRRVHGLYKHLIHIKHQTLVFPALPIKVIPFPLAEAQAAVFSRVWAHELTLPSREEMEAWERKEAEDKGSKFHVFPKGGDADYINAMHDWAMKAKDNAKEPPKWGDELLYQRSIYAQAKMKFEQTGKTARTLEELGFHYTPEPSRVDEARKEDPELDVAG